MLGAWFWVSGTSTDIARVFISWWGSASGTRVDRNRNNDSLWRSRRRSEVGSGLVSWRKAHAQKYWARSLGAPYSHLQNTSLLWHFHIWPFLPHPLVACSQVGSSFQSSAEWLLSYVNLADAFPQDTTLIIDDYWCVAFASEFVHSTIPGSYLHLSMF